MEACGQLGAALAGENVVKGSLGAPTNSVNMLHSHEVLPIHSFLCSGWPVGRLLAGHGWAAVLQLAIGAAVLAAGLAALAVAQSAEARARSKAA